MNLILQVILNVLLTITINAIFKINVVKQVQKEGEEIRNSTIDAVKTVIGTSIDERTSK